MKAKEMAEFVVKNPKTTIEEINKMIPEYSNGLHRRQWIFTFLKHLPNGLQAPYRQQLIDTKK